MRACIGALRDGTYYFEDYLETFPGGVLEPLLLPLALTIDGDRMVADFTGAAPQVPVPVNSTLAVSAAGVFIAVKSVFDPAAPMNQGSLRPIEVIAPLGTIVNVQPPAPAGSHGEIRKRVIAVMIGALSQVAPDKVAGDLCRTSFHNLLGGWDRRTGREWVHYEWSGGGNGAFAGHDGPSAMATVDWGDLTTVQPSEVIEARMPLLVEQSHLAIDSGGAGRSRGGLSMQRELRVLAADARYSLLADGAVLPAFGVLGGRSGVPVASFRRDAGGGEAAFDTPGKVAGELIVSGESVVLRSAGGGGYGDPLARDPALVAADVGEGYVSAAAARALYGVVLDGAAVDEGATLALRAALLAGRRRLLVVPSEDVFRPGAVSRRRVCRLHPQDAVALGVVDDDIVELGSDSAAPLRAWAVVDAAVAQGTVPLDERGKAILAVGSLLEVRRLTYGTPSDLP